MKEIKKIIIEKALNSELYYHLDEDSVNNSRNGYSSKTIQTEAGKIELRLHETVILALSQ